MTIASTEFGSMSRGRPYLPEYSESTEENHEIPSTRMPVLWTENRSPDILNTKQETSYEAEGFVMNRISSDMVKGKVGETQFYKAVVILTIL